MIGLIEGVNRGKDRFVSCRIEEESPDLFNGGREIGRAHV